MVTSGDSDRWKWSSAPDIVKSPAKFAAESWNNELSSK